MATVTKEGSKGKTSFALPRKVRATFTCADLFAGAGGIAVGFHAAGFKCCFFNEIDKQAAATFSLNFPSPTPFVCPIEELSAQDVLKQCGMDVGDLDLIVGGPPCQGFSIYAPQRSENDPRNHLFRHYVRLVLEGIKPKFIVMENVPGLVSLDNGRTLSNVKQAFEQAGYRVIFRILNAAHYGVPQDRWRLFFLGTSLPNVDLSFPEPTHYSVRRTNFTGAKTYTFSYAVGEPNGDSLFPTTLLPPTTVREALGDMPSIPSNGGGQEMAYSKEPQTQYQAAMRDGADMLYNHECNGVTAVNLERLKHVKPGGSWRDIPFHLLPAGLKRARRSDHTRRYGRLHPDEPTGTILTRCDPHWGTVFHYEQDRIISVREAARLQSFPDWFRFTGSVCDQYKQVGNAVPPLLAKTLAMHIKRIWKASNK